MTAIISTLQSFYRFCIIKLVSDDGNTVYVCIYVCMRAFQYLVVDLPFDQKSAAIIIYLLYEIIYIFKKKRKTNKYKKLFLYKILFYNLVLYRKRFQR
jgi:hypothetical protein